MKQAFLPSIGRLLPRLLMGVALIALAQPAQAQRGPGGFGGPGGFSRGGFGGFRGVDLMGALRRESVQEELKLSEEQKTQLEQLQERLRSQRGEQFRGFDPNLSEEERMARFREQFEKSRKENEAELQKILTDDQFRRLRQLALQSAGVQGMLQDESAADLKLSDKQKEDLQKLREERDQAFGSGRIWSQPREDQQKFNEEWNAKALTILSPTQAKAWQEKIGPPAGAQSSGSGASADAAKTTPSTPNTAAPTPHRATVENPTGEAPDGQVVMSFGTAAEAGAKPASGGARTLTFNFRFAPWVDVLKRFADAADLTLDLNDIPPGTFSYYDSGEYTPTEALDILNGYLLQKGYLLVRRDKFLVVVNIDEGVPPNLIPNVPLEELPNRGKNELMSIILPLEGVNADDAAREVEALVGPQGKVVPLKNSNALYISDIGSNLRQIQRLMASVTAKANPDEVQFRSFPLKHIPATEAEKVVRQIFGLGQAVPNVSSSRSSSGSRYGYGGSYGYDSRRDDNRGPAPPPMSLLTANKIQVASDPRTNTVMVTAPAAQMAIAEQAIKTIDVAEDANGEKIAFDDGSPHLKVYQIHSADAQEVTKTLDAIMPGVVVNEDGRARRIHVVATTPQHREIERLIAQLDGVGGGGGQSVAVLPLVKLDPLSAMGTLRSLFAADGNSAPTIEADLTGRRLMIRGSGDQITQIRTVLAQLGENGNGLADESRPRGPVRVVPLQGRDPEEFVRMLEAIWSSTDSNPIRVVVPPAPNPVRERRTPTTDQRSFPERPQQTRGSVPGPDTTQSTPPKFTPVAVRAASQTKVVEDEQADAAPQTNDSQAGSEVPPAISVPEENEAATAQPQPRSPASPSGDAPVAVSVTGGNLVLSSEDEAALDRLEQLIERLGQTVPARTRWTVYYLRSAEATEVALMLEQLLPSSSVSMSADSGSSGFFGGLSSMGSSLMQAAGVGTLGGGSQALRIIPDTRSNSLFVSGPADKVRDVEEMLKVLDSSELPESLRDRLPRMIPVEYTDAEEVAEIVKEVYKDYMEDRSNQAQRGANPFAMLMGGNSNDQKNRRKPAIELTIGVDTRTNQLIVSANDTLFRQIENLVATLDQSAFEAKRTVRVVRLDHADSTVVQQAVTSLLPKVHVSSGGGNRSEKSKTSSGSDSKNGSGGQSSPSSDRGGNDADAMRQYFEQRMRERMQGGDSGRGSSGSGYQGRSSSVGRPSWGGFGSGRSSSSSSRGGR